MDIAGLMMAAGGGSRYGGCKQLAPVNGKPLVLNSLEQLVAVTGSDTYIVLGAYRAEVLTVVSGLATVVFNPCWERGLGHSIATGIEAIRASCRYQAVLIALADQHRIRQRDYAKLIHKFDGRKIVATDYDGHPGAPAIFPAKRFDDLCKLDGDQGARIMLASMRSDIELLPLPAARFDIDRKTDISMYP